MYYENLKQQYLTNDNEVSNCFSSLNFESNSYEILEQDLKEIIKVATLLKQAKDTSTWEIRGYTDNLESPDNRIELSLLRAKKVKEIIIQQGLQSSKFITKGMGDQYALASNSTKKGRATNRRVEIVAFKN